MARLFFILHDREVRMIYKRPYIIRKATIAGGKEVTVPPFCPMQPGDQVVALCDGFMLVVPEGAQVDEQKLLQAIRLKKEE